MAMVKISDKKFKRELLALEKSGMIEKEFVKFATGTHTIYKTWSGVEVYRATVDFPNGFAAFSTLECMINEDYKAELEGFAKLTKKLLK